MLGSNRTQWWVTISFVLYGYCIAKWEPGGHLKPDPYNRPFQVLNAHGCAEAEELSRFESRNLAAVEELIAREQVDCDYVHTSAIDVFFRDEDWAAALVKVESLRKTGIIGAADLTTSSSKEEAERVSTPTSIYTNMTHDPVRCLG